MLDLLRRNRAFRLLYMAQIVSFCGDWFATVALLGLVSKLTHGSALAQTSVFIAQSLPAALVTPWAGPTADRFDRRVVMVVVSSVQAVAALGFLLAGSGRLWVVYVAMSLVTALGAFFGPASSAALPNLVDPDDLPVAATAIGATWGTMLAVGAVLGGIFTKFFGRNASFIADAASFVIAGSLIALIRRPTRSAAATAAIAAKNRMRPIHDTREALHAARHNHPLFYLLFVKAGFGLASGVVGLLSVLATKRLHDGDIGTSLLLGARGVGVVMGPVLAGRYARRNVPEILRVCSLAGLVYGIGYALVGASNWLIPTMILVAIAHLGGGAEWMLSTYGLQATAPDEIRGRIMAADFALVSVSMTASFLVAGVLEPWLGAGGTLATMGAVSCLWGLLYLRLTATLRHEMVV